MNFCKIMGLSYNLQNPVYRICVRCLLQLVSCKRVIHADLGDWITAAGKGVTCGFKRVDCIWNVMAHAQKTDFVFRRNGRVHLYRQMRQFSRLLATEVCASAVVMLDTPCSEVVWRVLATHSIRRFPLHFPTRVSPCANTFQLDSTNTPPKFFLPKNNFGLLSWKRAITKYKYFWTTIWVMQKKKRKTRFLRNSE